MGGKAQGWRKRLNGVLLDTSFLISLSDPNRSNHAAADTYFKEFKRNGWTMYLSVIVASEFQVGQPVTDLPLSSFLIAPFNIDDAIECGNLGRLALATRDENDNRTRLKDDLKLIAQCKNQGISHFICEDEKLAAKYAKKLKDAGKAPGLPEVILLRDGFDSGIFHNGQKSLNDGTDPAPGWGMY